MPVSPNKADQEHVEMACSATMPPVWYLNHYRCPTCQLDWQDEWDCACNDKCPDCNKEIEPYESDLIES